MFKLTKAFQSTTIPYLIFPLGNKISSERMTEVILTTFSCLIERFNRTPKKVKITMKDKTIAVETDLSLISRLLIASRARPRVDVRYNFSTNSCDWCPNFATNAIYCLAKLEDWSVNQWRGQSYLGNARLSVFVHPESSKCKPSSNLTRSALSLSLLLTHLQFFEWGFIRHSYNPPPICTYSTYSWKLEKSVSST